MCKRISYIVLLGRDEIIAFLRTFSKPGKYLQQRSTVKCNINNRKMFIKQNKMHIFFYHDIDNTRKPHVEGL